MKDSVVFEKFCAGSLVSFGRLGNWGTGPKRVALGLVGTYDDMSCNEHYSDDSILYLSYDLRLRCEAGYVGQIHPKKCKLDTQTHILPAWMIARHGSAWVRMALLGIDMFRGTLFGTCLRAPKRLPMTSPSSGSSLFPPLEPGIPTNPDHLG